MKKIKYFLGLGLLSFLLVPTFASYEARRSNVDIISTSIYYNDIDSVTRNYYGNSRYCTSAGNNITSVSSDYSYCLYDNFSNYSFDCSPLLNSGIWYSNLTGTIHFTSEEGFSGYNNGHDSGLPTSNSWNFGYTNSYFDGSAYHSNKIGNNYGYMIRSAFFPVGTTTVSVNNPGYVHLIYRSDSDFDFNPGSDLPYSGDILHYYYFNSLYLESDYGHYKDVPEGYSKRKIFNNLDFNYSYIALNTGDNSLLFGSTFSPIKWVQNVNGNQRIQPSIHTGYLILNFIDYDSVGLTGQSTIILQLSGDKIVYNYYNQYENNIYNLNLLTPRSVGYLSFNGSVDNAYTGLYDFVVSNGLIFDSFGSFQNGLILRRYSLGYVDNDPNTHEPYCSSTSYSDYLFTFEEDDSVGNLVPPYDIAPGQWSGGAGLNDYQYQRVCRTSSGYEFCQDLLVGSGYSTGDSFIGPDGKVYFIGDVPGFLNEFSEGTGFFSTSFIDSDGLISTGYYLNFFSSGFFGKCPYPYYSSSFNFLDKISSVKIGNFYPFMSILCFNSAFRYGLDNHYFDDFGIFDNGTEQPLMYGTTKHHKTLFRFFDVLLSFGLILILRALFRIFH